MSNFENLYSYILIDSETGVFLNLDMEVDDESDPISYPLNWDEVEVICEMIDATPSIIDADPSLRIALVAVNPSSFEDFMLARTRCYIWAMYDLLGEDPNASVVMSNAGFPFDL